MTMIRALAPVVLTATGPLAAVELGETPFFPGANAILHLSAPIGGDGVVTVEGSDDEGTTWEEIRTADADSGTVIEVSPLYKQVRLNVTTAGTGTVSAALEGVQ